MPVSNEHLTNMCQVWDGITLYMMDVAKAEAAEEAGKVQRTKNLSASELKTKAQFLAEKRKKAYKTRQMKADD